MGLGKGMFLDVKSGNLTPGMVVALLPCPIDDEDEEDICCWLVEVDLNDEDICMLDEDELLCCFKMDWGWELIGATGCFWGSGASGCWEGGTNGCWEGGANDCWAGGAMGFCCSGGGADGWGCWGTVAGIWCCSRFALPGLMYIGVAVAP